jgi:hypothetical protein
MRTFLLPLIWNEFWKNKTTIQTCGSTNYNIHSNMPSSNLPILPYCPLNQHRTHPRQANLLPWEEVAMDLIGPWTVKLPNKTYEFMALTCIDPVTNFPDAIRLRNKTASHVGMQFENLWLSCYPRPVCCIHDCGTKFMGADFQQILQRSGIKDVTISFRNPQSNAICEQLHQLVGNALRVFLSQDIPFNVHNVAELVDSAISAALHASRATIH